MLKQFVAAVAGGLMIAIGGTVFLNSYISTQNTYIGAFFFTVALICICLKGYGLFTGRIGYLADNLTKAELAGVSMMMPTTFFKTPSSRHGPTSTISGEMPKCLPGYTALL